MALIRPGGTALTEYAIDCVLKDSGSEGTLDVLDIGCGDGTADIFIAEKYGFNVKGVDIDPEKVKEAKANGADAVEADSSLLPFTSKSFDIVMMECTFSVLDRQEESLHEAYCMLKDGGYLIISDVYCREPDMERFKKDYIDAMRLFRRPRNEGDCESGEKLPSPYLQDGAVVLDGLSIPLDELGMNAVLFEDRSTDLKAFAAQAILDYGSLDKYFETVGEENACACKCKKPGYFLLITRKPVK